MALTAVSESAARSLIDRSEFIWHQRFELAPGVFTPGSNDVEWLLRRSRVPADLAGVRALDVGTTNGGAAFELERRGAEVTVVDVEDITRFGFDQLRALLGSSATFVQASVYELSRLFAEPFDLVLFWGVLYHLRHPLLGLDNLRSVTKGRAVLETVMLEPAPGQSAAACISAFYRLDGLGGDWANWFAPTFETLQQWCGSSGFRAELLAEWPENAPRRCLMELTPLPGPPEYEQISLERPIRCTVEPFRR